MAAPTFTPTRSHSQRQRHQRLIQLAQEWSLPSLTDPTAAPPPLSRPPNPPSFRTSSDDAHAEQLLLRRRQQTSSAPPHSLSNSLSSPLLNRSFTSKKSRSQDSAKQVFEALLDYVRSGGTSAGVAEALLLRLQVLGATLDAIPQKKSVSNLLTKRRSLGPDESERRGQVLREAVKGGAVDMVSVLVPHADPHSLDEAVGISIRMRMVEITEVLLAYGASVSDSALAQDEFRKACAEGGHAELIDIILRSQGNPLGVLSSQGIVDAARAGCFDTVARLSRSGADGNFDNAEGLKVAVGQGRRDVALAIALGSNPPQRPGVDEAFTIIFSQPSMSPNDKLALAELLLCAGAQGEAVDIGLIHAAASGFLELVRLLVSHGASTTFRDAHAVRNAVSKGQYGLLEILLSGSVPFDPEHASRCVDLIPLKTSHEYRHSILTLLLRRGASGMALHNALIDAVEAGDVESARLLVTPEFPIRRRMGNGDAPVANGAVADEVHDVASVDHNGGLSFSIAVTRGDVPMTKLLLSAKPTQETLAQIFPAACVLSSPEARYQIAEAFLLAGLTSQALDVALQEAISKDPAQRDERLISLLLSHNANINYADGAGLAAAIQKGDVSLIRTLVRAASPETAGHVVPSAMKLEDPATRREVVGFLLDAGAASSREKISAALLTTVSSPPVDIRMLRLLLEQGEADMTLTEGVALGVALGDPDPTVTKMLLRHGRPSPELVRKHLATLMALPSTQSKTTKMQAVLPQTTPDDRNEMLVQEISSATKTPDEDLSLSPLTMLLSAKADVNTHKGRALCIAVAAANSAIVSALLDANPSPETVQLAFPHAIHNQDATNRRAFTERLIAAGAPKREITRALAYCVDTHTSDLSLLTLLVAHSDTSDGIALTKAIRKESPEVVELLLLKGTSPPDILDKALQQCMEVSNRDARLEMSNLLLAKGVNAAAISSALLAAVNDVDFALGKVLIEAGGNLADCDSQGIVRACHSGSLDMLSLLLSGMPEPNMEVLREAFQAATDVGDLKARAVIFEMLLGKGVTGEVVDEQLVSAARYGEAGSEMLRVLLIAGADPNYNGGEAVCAAMRSAFLGNLELLLGRGFCHESQKRPSGETLSQALKASWKLSRETRSTAVNWLFEAGLTASDEMHLTLIEIVNSEDEDPELVKLLLERGASPAYNGCKAIIDVAARASLPLLSTLLEYHTPEGELDHILTSAFKSDNVESWCNENGLSALAMLLERIPDERLSGATISVVLGLFPTKALDLVDSLASALLKHGVDVNYNNGTPLRLAIAAGNLPWLSALLSGPPCTPPNPSTLSIALSSVFTSSLDEDAALPLVSALTNHNLDGTTLDAMHPHPIPLLVLALDRYPRSRAILQCLLDAGFYHDQITTHPVPPHATPEPITLLLWSLLQPQKRISTSVISLLVSSGAKVNFETRKSRITPLILAIQSRRPDVVKILLAHGADVHARDATGATPLSMAVSLGGDAAVDMSRSILASGASRNDGSLHNAAAGLNLGVMEALMDNGHDPDFPCALHGGRTALAELCARGGSAAALDPGREILLEKVMGSLIDRGTDLSIQSSGKSALLLALEAEEPVVVTRALLRSGMWKHVNDASNLFLHGRFTYSPTMYLRVLPRTAHTDALYALLRANRCEDRFFAHEGPQPDGAVGLPPDLAAAEQERRRDAARRAAEEEEHLLALQRARELQELRTKLYISHADLETSRRRQEQKETLAFLNQKAEVEKGLAAEARARRRAEERAEMEHEERLTREVLSRARSEAELGVEAEERRAEAEVRGQVRVGLQRAENERGVLAIRGEGGPPVAMRGGSMRSGTGRHM
ncbi:uncharacterized protein DNG_01503 [Cephalotrichum gorgonifer]|uniref:Uncharacterized protein n=1 Tax=Cephalotrichum gorgonifer TaxID=2041049 RepID=A0AAE8MS02_9PEZI|nr:uncharacterized protein DNG_01503 [Cephalotrichum gorgonifer]